MSDIKRCNACQQVKIKADFDRHPQNRDGRQSTCRACQAEATPIRRHGLTRIEKAQIAEEQGGCLACLTTNPGPKGWVVDHDHRCCGPVNSCWKCRRGILCGRCNTALGMAGDDPVVLRSLADYLDAHRLREPSQSTDQSTDPDDRLATACPTEKTDGRTYVQGGYFTNFESSTYVPRARIPNDHEMAAAQAALRASHPAHHGPSPIATPDAATAATSPEPHR